MGAKAQSARTYVFNQQPKREAVATPFWPDLDGSVYLQDVPSDEIMAFQQMELAQANGALLCKSLVVLEDDGTYSPIFVYPDDITQVSHLGTALLLPVTEAANSFFGFTKGTVEQAKNDLKPITNNASGIGSVQTASIVP